MATPVSECLYCSKLPVLDELMIPICDLSVAKLYLFKEQSYRGRVNVVYNQHGVELFELSDEERNAFFSDVACAARALQNCFTPTKINYGAYSDRLSHLHVHIAPKYEGEYGFGGTFEMNPQKCYLTDAEYGQLVQQIRSAIEG